MEGRGGGYRCKGWRGGGTGAKGSDVLWLDGPECNAVTWVITVTE